MFLNSFFLSKIVSTNVNTIYFREYLIKCSYVKSLGHSNIYFLSIYIYILNFLQAVRLTYVSKRIVTKYAKKEYSLQVIGNNYELCYFSVEQITQRPRNKILDSMLQHINWMQIHIFFFVFFFFFLF